MWSFLNATFGDLQREVLGDASFQLATQGFLVKTRGRAMEITPDSAQSVDIGQELDRVCQILS